MDNTFAIFATVLCFGFALMNLLFIINGLGSSIVVMSLVTCFICGVCCMLMIGG